MDIRNFFKNTNDDKDSSHPHLIKKQKVIKTPAIINTNNEIIVGKIIESQDIEPKPSKEYNDHPYDIANFLDKDNISLEERHLLLKKIYIPPLNFQYPQTVCANRKLKFQNSYFTRWLWLLYSIRDNGAYCKICVLFGPRYAGKNLVKLNSLVKTPFNKYKDAGEIFDNHQKTNYHKSCELMISSKESIQSGDVIPISSHIDKSRITIAKENRCKIRLIIEAILYCGLQGLALRGHLDSGSLNFNNNDNEGNFRGLIKFKALGDSALMESINSSNKNATYLSPRIQNEIIDVCNNIILEKLITEINSAPCFSILADETTDIAGIEQMSLCARYIDTQITL
ncbi:uncharacterized protein LOC135926723 [Gordionus sp. m RMFG-2023]|uniref:uncharacterized protein LOC135926723 n=1 Tax=Gordionus sp. m RMFG-2023 TaxID=3053472 RepID=UPI0031FCCEC8